MDGFDPAHMPATGTPLAGGLEWWYGIELIEKAISEDCAKLQEERTRFASSHTWENNVGEIYKAINSFLLVKP